MFTKLAVAGVSLFTFSSQVALAQSSIFQPGVYAQIEFGGPAKSHRFEAQLALGARAPHSHENLETGQHYKINYFAFEASESRGNMLQLFGAPIAAWAQPQTEYVLRQNEEATAESGSWFSRNWWIIGLGVLATGAVVVASASSSGSSDTTDGGNETNCGVAGTAPGTGPGGLVVDPNCL